MTDPTTIRRAAPAVDTSAERLTALRDILREILGQPVIRSLTRGDEVFDAFLAAVAQRQREVVAEALANWGHHDHGCWMHSGQPGHSCTCGFDQALDRLAPKEGW